MNFLPHIAERVLGKPLLVHPQKAAIILSVLGERIGGDACLAPIDETALVMLLKPAATRFVGEPGGPVDANGRRRTLYYASKGVALIPIIGTLVNRGAYIGASSGVLSYEGLAAQVEGALSDTSVRAILLDIDSPGGEANGAFAFYDVLREARQKKPITAFVNDMAASAAYGIAAQADEIVISQSSVVGSIGVVMAHMDQSEELKKRGRKVTLIYAGAHKVDGNSFEPLPEAVRGDLQGEVNAFMDRFVAAVHAGRPSFSEAAIRGTEARPFIGATAIEAGLADRVGSFHETLSRLSARSHNYGAIRMNDDPRVYSQAEHDQAIIAARAAERTEMEQRAASLVTAAVGEAGAAVLARIRGILTHAEATDRQSQALILAFDTDMSVEAAAKVLAASPKVAAAVPGSMVPSVAGRSAPHVGGDPLAGRDPDPAASWDAAIAKANKMTGAKSRAA